MIKNINLVQLSFFWGLIVFTQLTNAQILLDLKQGNGEPYIVGLYSEQKLIEACHLILRNSEVRQALNKAFTERAKIDMQDSADSCFSIGATLHYLACDTIEEKNLAAQLAAHYYVKSLILGNNTARTLLVYRYPPAKPIIDSLAKTTEPIDQSLFELLVKLTYDYRIKDKKYQTTKRNR